MYSRSPCIFLSPDKKKCYTFTVGETKGKKKAKLSLCLTKHHAMKAYWGSGGIAPRILDLGTRWR
jgi:hypothetical protein